MMNRIRERLEEWMAAVAFAEQGDHATARQFIRSGYRPTVAVRRRPRRQDRMAARAPVPRG